MGKYIKRDAFIAWLKRIPLKDLSDGRGLCRIIMEEDFKRAIRELPGEMIVDVAPVGWISVKDRLPEVGGYVVCIAKRNPFSRFMPMAARIEKNGWVNPITEQYISEVTHWMPLPEPPMSARMDGDAERRNT